jgi:hypothetical protein
MHPKFDFEWVLQVCAFYVKRSLESWSTHTPDWSSFGPFETVSHLHNTFNKDPF